MQLSLAMTFDTSGVVVQRAGNHQTRDNGTIKDNVERILGNGNKSETTVLLVLVYDTLHSLG